MFLNLRERFKDDATQTSQNNSKKTGMCLRKMKHKLSSTVPFEKFSFAHASGRIDQ